MNPTRLHCFCFDEPERIECVEGCAQDPTDAYCVAVDAGPTDGAVDAGPDVPASNCIATCEGDTPVCDEDVTMECVQCVVPADCAGVPDRSMCESNSCVQCANSTQCDTAEASLCGDEGLCTSCGVNDDCVGVTDGDANVLSVCDTSGVVGVCVGCTEATAAR